MCTRTARDGPWTIGASERRRRLAAPRSQSPGRTCGAVCAGWITCADAVAKPVRDGCRRTSLLHGCYTADLDVGARRCPGQWAAWRLPNPLFQDRTYGLLPDSPQNSRWGTTNGDCRSMPVRGRQVRWFDGSRTEVAAPPLLSSGPPPGFRSGWAIGTKILRSVPLTTNFAGRRCGRVTQVHGGGRCDRVVDVGCGCQPCHPIVRRWVTFLRWLDLCVYYCSCPM